MKIGILGSGIVAKTLALGFNQYGYQVALGTSNPQKLMVWQKQSNINIPIISFEKSAEFGEIIVLAVKGKAAITVLESIDEKYLIGKTVIDTTNPIEDIPPVNGVLRFFTEQNKSLMELMQEKFPKSNFVKAFNSVGSAFMINPDFNGVKPTMFIAGNNSSAKEQVEKILKQFGWETQDMGMAEAAGSIESLCILWCIPGFRENSWSHAFKLLKK